MTDQKSIDFSEVERILSLEEGHFLDFKRREVGAAKLSEFISAFGNTLGGEILIGIGEVADKSKRFWNGFSRPEDANGIFQVIEKMTPLATHYSATILHCAREFGHVLQLVVPKTRDVLPSHDGTVFIRRNAQNLRVVTPEALERLRLDKGVTSFEDERVNIYPSTITNSTVAI